jgi:hypothetical protein
VIRPILHKYYFFSSWTARKFVGLSTSILQKTPSSSSDYLQLISKRHIWKANEPGDLAFATGEVAAVSDLFFRYANTSDVGTDDKGCSYLTPSGARKMLASIGENPDDETFDALFRTADLNGDRKLQLQEFLLSADKVLGGNPSNIVLVVGGPGSGKGVLCNRLAKECGCVHMSSGKLLRDEVSRGTPLGRQVADSIARGELVNSSVITTLVRRNMRKFLGTKESENEGQPVLLQQSRNSNTVKPSSMVGCALYVAFCCF